MAQFNYYLYNESYQDARNTETNLLIILQLHLTKGFIASSLTTMWDHTDGRANQYHCASTTYLLSCLDLLFTIIIDRSVGAPGHVKYAVDGMNDIDKCMLKLTIKSY